MKKRDILGLVFVGVMALGAMLGQVRADTGFGSATRIERGAIQGTRLVTISSTAGTAFFAASTIRPDGMCRNISTFTVWIGSVSATQNNATHWNITNGFPIYNLETFELDGQYTGTLYATCDTAVASCSLRCLDTLVIR